MDFKDNEIICTVYTVSFDELQQIFPWLGEEKPKSKRGRKPKAHRTSGEGIKMEATV